MARPSKYSPELRRRAIAEVIERDRTVVDVARDLGVGSPETVRNWVKQARRDAGLETGPTTEELAEIKRLRKEVADPLRTKQLRAGLTLHLVGSIDEVLLLALLPARGAVPSKRVVRRAQASMQ